MFLYQVTHIESLTNHVSRLFLNLAEGPALRYEAGQYIEVIHQDNTVSPLSIACAPNASGTLEFQLFHPTENDKAQQLLKTAKEDKYWTISGPFGICTASRLHPQKPIIFLARSTGFAPIKAVIEAVAQTPHPPMHLYWSVSRRADLYLMQQIEEWTQQITDFTFSPIFTKESLDQTRSQLLQDIVLHDHPDLTPHQVYVSGPRPLVYAVFYALQKHGLHQEFFYSDVFV